MKRFAIIAVCAIAVSAVVVSWTIADSHGKERVASAMEEKGAPDMVGTWHGTNHAVLAGEGNHKSGEPDKVIFKDHDVVSIVINKQQGRRFHGKMTSQHTSETLVGFIDPDNTTVWMVDEDGIITGKIMKDGSLWYRYLESSGEGDNSLVASYAHFKKQ